MDDSIIQAKSDIRRGSVDTGDLRPFTFGSLFAGIGGFDLGLERAGMTCAWQVENDPYAIRVLEKHWPNVRRCKDVRDFPPEPFEDWRVDLICGGFPCQDISEAGPSIGISGARSGLWNEFARIIRVLGPRFVIVENVSALLVRGIDTVLRDLASLRYDAEWGLLSACAFSAPHSRERVFIVAYPSGERFVAGQVQRQLLQKVVREEASASEWRNVDKQRGNISGRFRPFPGARFPRVHDGLPSRVDRLRGLGNAVVPQISEWIGRRILESEAEPA
jgi:DNA (cytosine-5)-methyltransferase 1